MDDKKLMKWIEKTDDTVKQISILRMDYPDDETKTELNRQLDTILQMIDELIIEHPNIVELSNCRSRTNHAKDRLNIY